MTLEFEKLTSELEKMAQTAVRRQQRRDELVAEFRDTLRAYSSNWVAIEAALAQAAAKADEKFFRAAKPLDETEPLNAAVDAPSPPTQATIIATDGSQIMPDRHAAYLYYLINIGCIIYHHGQDVAPNVISVPKIVYPDKENEIANFPTTSGEVSIMRDLEEIGALATMTANQQTQGPVLSLLDQRLLYWQFGANGSIDHDVSVKWCEQMTKLHRAGALLAGYVDQSDTNYVVTLLQALQAMSDPEFNWRILGNSKKIVELADKDLFSTLLKPGQRSKVFVINSPQNESFANQDPANEVCFFFLNPEQNGQKAVRIDIPRWVADNSSHIEMIHSLIIEQARILGNYPYVLLRAHELAVVGKQDANDLNFMIDVVMNRYDVSKDITSKQGSKNLTIGGRSRHEGV